ncbi:MAG: hypothetical protein A3I02_02000 [Betaproteobacteria bacterium RIFCSPLOWO2_02_FULL_67_26]|nr:MAG: hypothetical protein A3I02_02000 [Betaproteobacteria bacterium RIFCSPLOWO2_02_FULL_67_26]
MKLRSIKWFYQVWAALAMALLIAAAPARATETLTFIHTDVAGSPVAATDINGNVIWREGYRPYGERTRNESAAAGNRQFFHGKAFDTDTGLSYFGARYYDPVVGRFMGVDAQGFDEKNLHSFNRYAYGNNNPYKFVDPDGRAGQAILPMIVGVGLWLGFDALAPMPAVPAGSGQVIPTSFPDLGVTAAGLGVIKAIGIGASVAKSVGPVAGGGAKLENLTTSEIARIQNAADRTGTEISVVGSRAKGTAGPTSDWDYVIPESTRGSTAHSMKSSLPEGQRGLGEPRNQDFLRGTVDPNKPYITFTPTPR